jgi:hypothetical protein
LKAAAEHIPIAKMNTADTKLSFYPLKILKRYLGQNLTD